LLDVVQVIRIQDDNPRFRLVLQQVGQWRQINRWYAHQRMLRTLIFHAYGELNDEAPGRRQMQQIRKDGIRERVPVVVQMETDPRHLIFFAATPQVLRSEERRAGKEGT